MGTHVGCVVRTQNINTKMFSGDDVSMFRTRMLSEKVRLEENRASRPPGLM